MAPPKTLYYVPQAHLASSNGTKVEFAGVLHFGEDFTNNMMFVAITANTGLFEGKMGHPQPSKINEDQISFYMKQLQQSPSLPLYDQEVQQMILSSTPWKYIDLETYIEKVKESVRSDNPDHGGASKNQDNSVEGSHTEKFKKREDELLQVIENRNKEINKLKSATSESDLLSEIKQIVIKNQEKIGNNQDMLDKLTKHIEHLVHKKGQHHAFLNVFKSPASIELDKASMTLTVIGSEVVVAGLEAAGGPFGLDLQRLRSDGTVNTISLPKCSPRNLSFHFLGQSPPISGPASKSSVLIFLDIDEPENTNKASLQFHGTTLKTDISCVLDQAMKFHQQVIFAMPPASPVNISIMMDILKPTMEVTHLLAIDMTDILVDTAEFIASSEEVIGTDGKKLKVYVNSPIKGPGWQSIPAISRATVLAIEALEPKCQIKRCDTCWGSHCGSCPDSTTSQDIAMDSGEVKDQEICLRCLNMHGGYCRSALKPCAHCGDKGHSFTLHEICDKETQDAIKASFGINFEFVAPGKATRPSVNRVYLPNRGGGGGPMRLKLGNNNHHQTSNFPKLTMVKKI